MQSTADLPALPVSSDSSVEYRHCPGFPGYCVGSDGGVWSCRKRNGLGRGRGTESVVGERWVRKKPSLNGNGYLSVWLLGRNIAVHRLILEAFVGPRTAGMECRHLDGNQGNNRLDNLAWGTRKENAADKVTHGTRAVGERHGAAKLTEVQVREIRSLADTMKQKDIARRFGVGKAIVSKIIHRLKWSHVR